MVYAEGTAVPVSRSRAELEELLRKHGVESIAIATSPDAASVTFHAPGDRWIRFRIPTVRRDDRRVVSFPSGKPRPPGQQAVAHAQLDRQTWRALLLVVKAKLESVESGIETFEQAFLANVLLPTGQTVGDATIPAIDRTYRGEAFTPTLELER